jgi:hypothetical protein
MISGLGGFDVLDMSSAYCMADKFGMEELQNGIMDCVRATYRISPHHHAHGHSHNHVSCSSCCHL